MIYNNHFLSVFFGTFPRSIGNVGAFKIADFLEIGGGLFIMLAPFLNSVDMWEKSFLTVTDIFLF